MCIVVANKLGVKFPSVKTIQACCQANPDGFSMAWNEKGEIKTFKTMSHKVMMKHYRKFINEHDESDTAFIFHARIATHGSLKLSNCHCWVSDGMAFAHNGILSIKNRGDMTDSETFFRDIFIPCYRQGGSDAALNAVNACIGTSKFAFLDGNGQIATFGAYNTDVDKNMYSNFSYIPIDDRYSPYMSGCVSWGNASNRGRACSEMGNKGHQSFQNEEKYRDWLADWEKKLKDDYPDLLF